LFVISIALTQKRSSGWRI